MDKEKMEKLREKLGLMMVSESTDNSELMRVSNEMDEQVLECLKKQMERRKSGE